eukprot:1159406-Alexandrium_andersonii.AAC.1
MCIRDSQTPLSAGQSWRHPYHTARSRGRRASRGMGVSDFRRFGAAERGCLLYTSDAADDM